MSMLRLIDERGMRPWLKCRASRVARGPGIRLHNHIYTGLPHLVALIGKRVELVFEAPRCRSSEVYSDGVWIGTAVDVRFATEQQRLRMYAADAALRERDQRDRDDWLTRAAGRAWAQQAELPPAVEQSPPLLDKLDALQSQSAAELAALAALTARPARAQSEDFARARDERA